jgi:2-iminobutanoate/2-iminopropanoate deaminase
MRKSVVSTTRAPAAIGPYSQGIQTANLVFVSGQLGIDPVTGALPEGVRAQAIRSCENVKEVLAASGCSTSDVVKTTIFLADMKDFAVVNEVYASFFDKEPPARSTVQVAGLPKGGLVEIEAIAVSRG